MHRALVVLALLSATACPNPEVKDGRRRPRTVQAKIGTFDPNADVVLDLDKYGSERPDDYAMQMAFNQAFEPMDDCVRVAKTRRGLEPEAVLSNGMMDISVKLDGPKGKAASVNATLPEGMTADAELTECLREAVATVKFPKYDGPPVVVEFHTEVDAGYMDE